MDRDTVGRWTAITVITPIPWWWALWLRFNFWRVGVSRRLKGPSRIERDLAKLSFIGFAHWGVVSRVPAGAGLARARRLRPACLVFQSNFNGFAAEYIEAFSRILTAGMRAIWGGGYGVPGPLPVGPFQAHILRHKLPTGNYYAAYPETSTKMVLAALEVRRLQQQFHERFSTASPEEFAAGYRQLLTDVQGRL
jgi:hypothetical protein